MVSELNWHIVFSKFHYLKNMQTWDILVFWCIVVFFGNRKEFCNIILVWLECCDIIYYWRTQRPWYQFDDWFLYLQQQIHLIGNPVVWYSAFLSVILYVGVFVFYLMRRQRACYDLSESKTCSDE